ncbi:MAG TPA: hypothetical protein VGE66_01810 [Chitinophagaceae bacterium]
MKNTFFLAIAALFLSATASAQTTDSTKVKYPTNPSAPIPTTTAWAKTDDFLPAHLKGATSATIEPKHFLPVLGSFQPSGTSTETLTVTVDEQNVGIVWIDGLPQGRVKAILKKSPATYKIPAQKTAEGKSVSEGTLIYDKDANTLSVAIGTAFNDADPAAPFTSTTSSKKVWKYTGAKVDAVAQTAAPVEQQQEQPQQQQ